MPGDVLNESHDCVDRLHDFGQTCDFAVGVFGLANRGGDEFGRALELPADVVDRARQLADRGNHVTGAARRLLRVMQRALHAVSGLSRRGQQGGGGRLHGPGIADHGIEHFVDARAKLGDGTLDRDPAAFSLRPDYALLLVDPALGNILVDRHPAASRDRVPRNADDAAVLQSGFVVGGMPLGDPLSHRPAMLLRVSIEAAGLRAVPEQLDDVAAGFRQVRRDAVHAYVGLVAEPQSLVRVENAEPEIDAVQGGSKLESLLVQTARHKRAEQGHGKDRDRARRHSHRQPARRHGEGIDGSHRVGIDPDRSHGSEMVRNNGEREQHGGSNGAPPSVLPRGQGQGGHPESHAEQDGGRDEIQRPAHVSRHFKRPHAEVVHTRNPGAEHCAANRRHWPAFEIRGEAEPGGGYQDGREQRNGGHGHVVGHRDPRLVGKHRDEMRGPDSASGCGTCRHDPKGP